MALMLAQIWRIHPSEKAGVAAALVVLLLLVVLLPAGSRLLVRGPVLLLLAYFVLLGIDQLMPDSVAVPLEYVGGFFLLCCIGRGLFLIGVESILAPWLFRPAPKIFLDLSQGLVYAAAFVVMLGAAGVDPGSLVTGSALITAAIGLSMRDSLGNLFAGLAIQIENPFEVGDWIQFDERPEHIGKVVEINWRATKVVTLDQVFVVVPNSQLAQAPIRNFTKPEAHSRRSIYVVAPYDVPTRTVHQVILEAIADSFGVLETPAPSVVTNDYTDRGVEYWVRFFTREFDKRDGVDGGVRDRISYALRRHDIAIPGPLRRVTLQTLDRKFEEEEQATRLHERREALRCVDFLRPLPEEALEQLALAARRRHFAAGETIIRQDDEGSDLFIVHQGEVAISARKPGGKPIELDRLGPQHFFGELSLMTGQRRSASVAATRDTELFVIGKSALEPILAAAPELVETISKTLSQRQAERERRWRQPGEDAGAAREERPLELLLRIKEFFSIKKT